MNQRTSISYWVILIVVFAIAMFGAAPATAATSCENLASLALPNAKINSVQIVAAGVFVQPGGGAARGEAGLAANPFAKLPAFCRVTATLTPTNDSDIKIEVWLPATGWNGKFEAVGNGGWAGTIPYPGLGQALAAGYAAAGTDTGHVGNNADFMPAHPEKLADRERGRPLHCRPVGRQAILDPLDFRLERQLRPGTGPG